MIFGSEFWNYLIPFLLVCGSNAVKELRQNWNYRKYYCATAHRVFYLPGREDALSQTMIDALNQLFMP